MARITNKTLHNFVAGRLSDSEAEEVMLYLAENEDALAYVDELWAQQLAWDDSEAASGLDVPTAQRIERRLIRRIHNSNFVGSVFRFGVVGFGMVAKATILPIAHKLMNPEREDEDHD